jgi:hypothetical protein
LSHHPQKKSENQHHQKYASGKEGALPHREPQVASQLLDLRVRPGADAMNPKFSSFVRACQMEFV